MTAGRSAGTEQGQGREHVCGDVCEAWGCDEPGTVRPSLSVPPARDSGRDEAREAVARWLWRAHMGYDWPASESTRNHYRELAEELLSLDPVAALLRDGTTT